MTVSKLVETHNGLCHPDVARLLHFLRCKNLPYSTDDVRKVCSEFSVCAELKLRYYSPEGGSLIKATQPMDRISIEFKGPLPYTSYNTYLLMVVDEYSRFAFAYPCPNTFTTTVIRCLDQLFALCGMPSCSLRSWIFLHVSWFKIVVAEARCLHQQIHTL